MGVLQGVLEAIFWVLLILGQAPAVAALWLIGLLMRAHDGLGPALRPLLRPRTPRGRRTVRRPRGNEPGVG
jgi:hypothetical protein